LRWHELYALIPVLVMVFVIGVQASYFFNLMDGSVAQLVQHINGVMSTAMR